MATATAPVTRETLEDRYVGLLWKVDGGSDDVTWSKLHHDLSWALTRLVAGTARVHPDDAGPIVGDLKELIDQTIISRIDELGIARDFGVSEGAAQMLAQASANGPNVVDDGSIVRDGVSGWNR